MLPYFKNYAVQTAWASISATSLLFVGTITALAANGATVQVRSKKTADAGDADSLVAKAYITCRVPTDLADLQFQDGAGTSVIMLDGNVIAQPAPLSNVN